MEIREVTEKLHLYIGQQFKFVGDQVYTKGELIHTLVGVNHENGMLLMKASTPSGLQFVSTS